MLMAKFVNQYKVVLQVKWVNRVVVSLVALTIDYIYPYPGLRTEPFQSEFRYVSVLN